MIAWAQERCVLLCALLVLQWGSSLAAASAEGATIMLRSGNIDTRLHPQRTHSSVRRSLAELAAPHSHAGWGVLTNREQLLVTLEPSAKSTQVGALLEAAGGYVSGYLPQRTLLVIGDDSVAAAAAVTPGVSWLGELAPHHKVDPDVSLLLSALDACGPAPLRAALAGGPPPPGLSAAQARVLASAAATAEGPASRAAAFHNASASIGLLVSFPPTYDAAPGGRGVHHASPAAAAAADWAPVLAARFPGALSLASPLGNGAAGASNGEAVSRQLQVEVEVGELHAVVEWLAAQPATHWVALRHGARLANRNAAAIIQSGQYAGRSSSDDSETFPIWAAGITGRDQVVGCGDSGVDYNHCFFRDDAINMNLASAWGVGVQSGTLVFNSTTHRKLRLYYALGDTRDSNGHGTHVAGSILGTPPGGAEQQGMAPDAKLAFIDLGAGQGDAIGPPSDLSTQYYPLTYSVGARISSDSWGSTSRAYDFLAASVDMFTWEFPDFLPIFAAGNDGQATGGVRTSGENTVTSPGTCKNCLTVGATDSMDSSAVASVDNAVVYDMTVTSPGSTAQQFRVMQAVFGRPVSTLIGGSYAVTSADPHDACSLLTNRQMLEGTVVLVERGGCNFDIKAAYVERAGAAAALMYDNELGAYFKLGTNGQTPVSIPAMAVTRRIGQGLHILVEAGVQLTAEFSEASPPDFNFENFAAYSSQGPTLDNRVKPDIVAPGLTESSHLGMGQCRTSYMQGTSMATPIVAGAAALVRQYFEDGFYPSGQAVDADGFAPSGMLVKAVLLCGAKALTGFEADTGLPLDPPPSFRQGFGRVYLKKSLPLAGSSEHRMHAVDMVEIEEGDVQRYCVTARGGALSVTLVWYDYPAMTSSGVALVNDLDLAVRAAGLNGTLLMGNGGGLTDIGGGDRLNTVEQVTLDKVPEGDVAIEVRGVSGFGKGGPQRYALVVLGDFEGSLASDANPAGPGDGDEARSCAVGTVAIRSGPQGLTSDSTVAFEFQTMGGADVLECRLEVAERTTELEDGSASGVHEWRECSSPAEYDSLPDGAYVFQVRSEGDSSTAVSQTFIKDTSPPGLDYSSRPPSVTASPYASFAFNASDASAVAYQCRLSVEGAVDAQGSVYDGAGNEVPLGEWLANCTSPLTLHWLLPGRWAFQVNATDEAGNHRDDLNEYAWQVEFEPGTTYARIVAGMMGPTASGQSEFEFVALQADDTGSVTEGSSGMECAFGEAPSDIPNAADVDPDDVSASWSSCVSPFTQDDLADGTYLFMVRPRDGRRRRTLLATDRYTTATSVFDVDTQPPVVTLVSGPGELASGSSVSFEWQAGEDGAEFVCELTPLDSPDGMTEGPCSSPTTYSSLGDGQYAFAVTATDRVGNEGEPLNVTFAVDTMPPVVLEVDYPAATPARDVSISWKVEDLGGGVMTEECKFVAIALAPAADASAAAAAASSFEPCTSPAAFEGLQEGIWAFSLRLTDAANLTTESPQYLVAVDNTPPITIIQQAPPVDTAQPPRVSFVLGADDGPAGSNVTMFQCQMGEVEEDEYRDIAGAEGGSSERLSDVKVAATGEGWDNCTEVQTYEALSSGYYLFSARSIDGAGNIGEPAPAQPFIVDDAIPVPVDEPESDGGGSNNTPWYFNVLIIGGSILLGISLLILLVNLIQRCMRRRMPRPSGPPSGRYGAAPPGIGAGGVPGRDPELDAAIAASLAQANGGAAAPAAYSAGDPYYNAGLAPAAAPPQYAPARYDAYGYPGAHTPAPAPAPIPSAPVYGAAYPPLYGAPPVQGARGGSGGALEPSLSGALASGSPAAARSGSLPRPGDRTEEEEAEYRRAVQASLREQHMAALQRQASSGAYPPPPDESDDPELAAAIQASLADVHGGGGWEASHTYPASQGGGGTWR